MMGDDDGVLANVAQAEQEHAIAEERGHAAAAQAQLAAQLEDARSKLGEARAAAQQGADRASELAASQQRSEALITRLQVWGGPTTGGALLGPPPYT